MFWGFFFTLPVEMKERKVKVAVDGSERAFAFGRGNGFRDIERVVDGQHEIVTRLRVVGSEKNLPFHYYYRKGLEAGGWNVEVDLSYERKEYGITYNSADRRYEIVIVVPSVISFANDEISATFGEGEYVFRRMVVGGNAFVAYSGSNKDILAFLGAKGTKPTFKLKVDSSFVVKTPDKYKKYKGVGDGTLLSLKNLMPAEWSPTNKDVYFDSEEGIAKYGIREGFVEFVSDDDATGFVCTDYAWWRKGTASRGFKICTH